MARKGTGIRILLCGEKIAALLFLALFMLVQHLPVTVSAAMDNSLSGYAAEGGTVLENGGSYAVFYPEESRGGPAAVINRLPVPIDLYYTDILELSYSVIADSETDRGSVPVTVHLYFTDGTVAEFSSASGSDGTGRLVMDLSRVAGTMQLSTVRIFATLAPEAHLRITPITVEKETSGEFAERFLCGEFTAYRGSASLSADEMSLSLNFYGSAGYVEGTVSAKLENASINALRFAVLSASRSCKLNIYYSYDETGEFSEENKVSIQLERSDTQKAYTAAIKDADRVKRLRISPDATGLTTVTLTSLLAVSAYADSTEYLGDVSSCTYANGEIVLRGTIPTATVALHRDAQIAIFALPYDRETVSAEDIPLKSASISARFEIKVPSAGNNAATKYLAALINEDGTVLPLAPAKYPAPAHAQKGDDLPFKGLMSNGCTDIYGGTAMADVDLSLLFDPRGSGYAYRYDGEYYYFSRETVDELKTVITRYDAEGCKILLRLICSNPGREVPFTFSYNESGVFLYALNAQTEEGRKYIRAAISFLSTSLAPSDYTVAGYVLGRNIETSGEYNFMGADYPLDEYGENYLLALRTVYAEAIKYSPEVRVFAGLGNEWQNPDVGRKFLFPNYDAFLLLETLAGRASAEGGVEFSVLVESDDMPEYTDGAAVFGGKQMYSFLDHLADEYSVVSPLPFLLWAPMGGSACSAYAYLYYCARFDGAEVFCLSIPETARLTDPAGLLELARSIDTAKTLVASASYLADYGIYAEDLEGYAPEKLVLRDVRQKELAQTSQIAAVGSVLFRDYTKKSNAPDLVRCENCEVPGYGEEYALCRFTSGHTGSCAAIIDLDDTDELSIADGLFFDVYIDCEGESTLTFTVVGGKVERQYNARLTRGSYRLYTNEAIPVGEGSSIRISLSGDGDVYLYRIGGESATKFDMRLSALLNDARGASTPIGDNAERNWGLLMIVIMVLTTATAIMMRRSGAQIKAEENEERDEDDRLFQDR